MFIALRPVDALPGSHLQGADEEQPAGPDERRLQVVGSELAQVSQRHPSGDINPSAAEVRLFEDCGLAFQQNALVVDRLIIDAPRHAGVFLDVSRPRRPGARHDVKTAVTVFEPAGNEAFTDPLGRKNRIS
jgi:hypothetical protein